MPKKLQHLNINCIGVPDDQRLALFPTSALLPLQQQLTYMELRGVALEGPYWDDPTDCILEPLEALTGLVELRIDCSPVYGKSVLAYSSMLSGMRSLTCLRLVSADVDPEVLASQTQLQHLDLSFCSLCPSDGAGAAALLSHLQQLLKLTH
jgi:hypothetical protein